MITNIPTLDRENYGRFLGLLPLTGPGWLVGAIEKSFGSDPLAGEGAPPIRPAYAPSQGSMAEELENWPGYAPPAPSPKKNSSA